MNISKFSPLNIVKPNPTFKGQSSQFIGNQRLNADTLSLSFKGNDFNKEASEELFNARTAEETKRLLDAGANPNAISQDGQTPLHCARTAEITKALLDAGANPNAIDDFGKTPLYYAETEEQKKLLLKATAISTKIFKFISLVGCRILHH